MRFIAIIVLFLMTSICVGQQIGTNIETPTITRQPISQNPDLQKTVTNVIGTYMAEKKIRLADNDAYLYSIALSFDTSGQISKVYFTKSTNKFLEQMLSPVGDLEFKIRTKWNNLKGAKDNYSNKLVLFPILVQTESSTNIQNLNSFLKDYTNLWPQLPKHDDKKSKILLPPFPFLISISVN